jgi:hypothetical protein
VVGGHGAGNAGLAGSTPAASTSRAEMRRWSLAGFRRLPVQERESLQEIEYLFVRLLTSQKVAKVDGTVKSSPARGGPRRANLEA